MDDYKTFVTDSLVEYDKNMKEQKKMLKNAVYYDHIQTENSMENDKIIFYDINDKIIFEADFEAISLYDPDHSLWTWGWGNPSWKRKWTRIISKIFNYGLSLDPEKSFHLKLELVNSRFIISDPIQIDIHLAIASALSKIPYIYPLPLPKDKTENKFKVIDKEKRRYNILKDYEEKYKILYLFLFNKRLPNNSDS